MWLSVWHISMPARRRVAGDKICFDIGRKFLSNCTMGSIVIKKSGTKENPDRLFHACPRYRKGSHCNYFRWAEDDEYEGLEHLGDVKTHAEMESDVVVLNYNLSWRMMSLEAEVRALRMQLYFGLIVVILVFMIMCMFFSGK
ncbi:hypothetical protein Ahy_B08g090254 [Arachis hypogaea]|uniref:GRF-type domain-containing protein n=1 Tax=Arachis hypogaea TaxID=3818 RepID=A0A444XZT4_ARAHY|nr:hypothetical protein Ahy_B08g090254 [Arachis hypogaea]